MQQHDERRIEYFLRRGAAEVRPLAAGMEGAVHPLGDGTLVTGARELVGVALPTVIDDAPPPAAVDDGLSIALQALAAVDAAVAAAA